MRELRLLSTADLAWSRSGNFRTILRQGGRLFLLRI
jgi:hypothetical protein